MRIAQRSACYSLDIRVNRVCRPRRPDPICCKTRQHRSREDRAGFTSDNGALLRTHRGTAVRAKLTHGHRLLAGGTSTSRDRARKRKNRGPSVRCARIASQRGLSNSHLSASRLERPSKQPSSLKSLRSSGPSIAMYATSNISMSLSTTSMYEDTLTITKWLVQYPACCVSFLHTTIISL